MVIDKRQVILFCGIQATGKTTFYKEQFFKTHIRISLDQLNTRNKEQRFIETCVLTWQPFVVDNTNPTRDERAKYIAIAKEHNFKVIGYHFRSTLNEAIDRNSKRTGKEKIPEAGIRGTFKKLQIPQFEEGFDELYYVEIATGKFNITNVAHEI